MKKLFILILLVMGLGLLTGCTNDNKFVAAPHEDVRIAIQGPDYYKLYLVDNYTLKTNTIKVCGDVVLMEAGTWMYGEAEYNCGTYPKQEVIQIRVSVKSDFN